MVFGSFFGRIDGLAVTFQGRTGDEKHGEEDNLFHKQWFSVPGSRCRIQRGIKNKVIFFTLPVKPGLTSLVKGLNVEF